MRELLGTQDRSEGRYRLLKKAREFQFARIRDYAHAFRFPGEYQFFCFVRNPYARLRSAWQNKFAYGHEQGYSRSIRRRELPRLRRFARTAGLPGGVDGAAIPFTTFLAYVESQPAGRRDHHWDDQHHVLLMEHIHYEQCFRMEGGFVPGMRQIFERLSLAGPVVERLLTTRRNASPAEEAPGCIPPTLRLERIGCMRVISRCSVVPRIPGAACERRRCHRVAAPHVAA